ncbi:MAG: diadenylate cyclase [Acholeplasmatales bacterium]|jgi:diadenylate cyclase|nr:diadenylate cyclase [Acholeplasmatales bacterium]MDD7394700.1 diadenylate cyclase [Acholeplasmatales bacterium]MDY4016642.1 diadenylate cyclase [Bacilli bacterium]CDD21285.1 putative uncharacterized protein [Firmicutes bacterium CAG:313]HCX07636.1 hypothetical protein [Acholeplasmatales bacterium]
MMEVLKNYIESLGHTYVSFIFECIIVLIAIGLLVYLAIYHFRSKTITILYASILILFAICFIMGLRIGFIVTLVMLLFVTLYGFVGDILGPKGRGYSKSSGKQNKQFITTEERKKELIDTLIRTASHLSNRKVGAIITIEKEHNLNSLIEGSVKLDAEVTFELLETIFHPNTRLHDGAVIIRGDRIMCASAFYQPSQKKDIPQHYGSRHRAAIGISEQSDAFTIVVSEETGQIAVTIGGTITGNVSLDDLRTALNQQLIVR